MNTNYLRFTEGEITVYLAENIRENVHASLKHAALLSQQKGNILYLNTAFTKRKLLAAYRRECGTKQIPAKELHFHDVQIGKLCNDIASIAGKIKELGIKYLIINSWEFANSSYVFKEKSMFGLLGLLHDLGVTIFIYSQASMKHTEAGRIQRGGLGKLAGVADRIVIVFFDEETDDFIEPEKEEKKILVDRKINDLAYARSQSEISHHGKVVVMEKEEEVLELVE